MTKRLLLCLPLLLTACMPQEDVVTAPADTSNTQTTQDAAEREHQKAVKEFNELISACNDAPVQKRVGDSYAAAHEYILLEESGAAVLRVIRPGQPVTKDYRTDRLNVELDADDTILRLTCG